MNYTDIKKYGKKITVNGKHFIELFDFIADGMWSCGLCSRANARKSVVSDIEKGIYGSEMFLAMENVRTLKTLETID